MGCEREPQRKADRETGKEYGLFFIIVVAIKNYHKFSTLKEPHVHCLAVL